MKVVFVQWGDEIDYAKLMVASCKKQGYEVIQLATLDAPEVPGVDQVIREAMDCLPMEYRMRRLAQMEPPYLSLDTDCLVVKDISDGFGDDVAMFPRKGEVEMPWNGGVIFVRNHQFMKDCYEEVKKMPLSLKAWYGDQHALRAVAKKYAVKELGRAWNFTPYQGEFLPYVKVYHFKGNRKGAMLHYAQIAGVVC